MKIRIRYKMESEEDAGRFIRAIRELMKKLEEMSEEG